MRLCLVYNFECVGLESASLKLLVLSYLDNKVRMCTRCAYNLPRFGGRCNQCGGELIESERNSVWYAYERSTWGLVFGKHIPYLDESESLEKRMTVMSAHLRSCNRYLSPNQFRQLVSAIIAGLCVPAPSPQAWKEVNPLAFELCQTLARYAWGPDGSGNRFGVHGWSDANKIADRVIRHCMNKQSLEFTADQLVPFLNAGPNADPDVEKRAKALDKYTQKCT